MFTTENAHVQKKQTYRASTFCVHFLVSTLLLFFVVSNVVFAQSFTNPLGNITLQGLLEKLIAIIIYFMTPIITLMIVYTGFLFVRAQGNPAKLTEARTALMWSLIGAVIVLGALGIASAVRGTVNSIVPS
jgi:hypothetical protein